MTFVSSILPLPPTDLNNVLSITDVGVIGLSWKPNTYDAGLPLLDYSIIYDQGNGDFVTSA